MTDSGGPPVTSERPGGQAGQALDQAQQAMQQQGVQFNLFAGSASAGRDQVPPVQPPWGRRESSELRGRDALVRELTASPDLGQPGRVEVLHGLGGVGKTRTALEIAYRSEQAGQQVWWVSAVDAASAGLGMLAVGYAAGASEAEFDHADHADVVWRQLGRVKSPWLLVIDNADDPEALRGPSRTALADGQGWLRRPPPGSMVLITSRDGDHGRWGRWTTLHRMAPLEPDPGAQVLLDLAPRGGSQQEAAALAARVGGLPLALQLAGQAIAKAAAVPAQWAEPALIRGFTDYRRALDERFNTVFPAPAAGMELDPEQARGLVGQTWELSLAVLDGRGMTEARAILRLLSCFGDAPIPCGLLLDVDVLATSDLLPGITGPRLWEVLTALDSLDLIGVDANTGPPIAPLVTLHPLVRDTNRGNGAVRDNSEYAALVVALLTNTRRKVADTGPESSREWETLAAHIAEPLASGTSNSTTRVIGHLDRFAYDAADTLRYLGLYVHAHQILDALLMAQTEQLGDNDPDTLSTRDLLARVWLGQGRWAEAEDAFAAVLAGRRQQVGDDHPDSLVVREDLARVWVEQGRWAEAEEAFTAVLAGRRKHLGDDHPDILTTCHELARVWLEQGRWAEAERAGAVVLARRRRRFGDDARETLATRHNLARVWVEQGRWAEAEDAFTAILITWRQQVGDDHPDTLFARHNLARVWLEQGRWAEAEDAFTAVLADRRQRLGDDHPATLATRYHLARVWLEQGRWAEAEDAFTAVLADRRQRLGDDHPDTHATRTLLMVARNAIASS